MSSVIENQMAALKDIFEKNDVKWNALPRRVRYACLFAFYEHFDADELSPHDIADSIVFKHNADDGIVSLYESFDTETDCCVAVVPCHLGDFSPNELQTKCVEFFKRAETAVFNCFQNSLFARDEIKRRMKDLGVSAIDKTKGLKIVLISDDDKVTATTAKKLRRHLCVEATAKPSHSHVSYELVFAEDVVGKIIEIEGQREYVPSATIVVDDVGNVCRFGEEGSIVVNVSAKSVKELYRKYRWAGLFAQNLRLYVRKPSVDDAIQNTIESCPGLFWYFNNGIIIICDSYKTLNDNTIELENMSIINGGQTTRQIGEIEFENDFYLLCKIIKSRSSVESERLKFISTVADASNRQKPIKSEDLIANGPVQRMLKKQLLAAGIFCSIKRGEGKGDKNKKPWERTSNTALAKILMSFMYQEPGLVRNSSIAVFSKRCINLAFDSKIKSDTDTYSSAMIRDLLKFSFFLKEWSGWVRKNTNDAEKISLMVNSDKLLIALFGVLMKYWFDRGLIPAISELDIDGAIHHVRQYDINCPLFVADVEQRQKEMYLLMELLYGILLGAFRDYKYRTNKTIPSNFAKSDTCYKAYVLLEAIKFFKANPLSPDRHDELNELANALFHRVTAEEFNVNKGLQAKFGTNYGAQKKPEPRVKDKKIRQRIKDKLLTLRKKVANKHEKKVSDIFDNAMLDKLSKFAPVDDQGLKELGFENTYEIRDEIFKIVSKAFPVEE